MRVLFKVLVTLLVVAIAALAVLLFVEIDAPWVAAALVRRAAARGVALEVDHAALDLRRGALLEGVVARTQATGETVEVSLDRLVLEHRLWPLLRGRLVVERLILERPAVEMVSSPPHLGPATIEVSEEAVVVRAVGRTRPAIERVSSAPYLGAPVVEASQAATRAFGEDRGEENADRLRLEIAEVLVRQGRWHSRARGTAGSTLLEGLDVTLRDVAVEAGAGPLLLALSARGWLEAASFGLGDRRLADIATAIDIERGRYRLAEFESVGPAGRLRVEEIEVDLAQDPYRYRVELSAEALDLATLLGVEESLGPARLALRGNGEGPGLAGAVAEISLHLDAGRLPTLPLLARLDRLVGTSLDGASYEPVELQVALVDGHLEIDPFVVVGDAGRLRAGGSMTLEGALDLRLAVGLPRELFDGAAVADDVLAALTDRQQWLDVPLRVTGTASEPRLLPDAEAIVAATRHLGGSAAAALQARVRAQLEALIAQRLGR